jgi:hypothetical protein
MNNLERMENLNTVYKGLYADLDEIKHKVVEAKNQVDKKNSHMNMKGDKHMVESH